MLRQSVKRPRATVANKLFFGMRYVIKRKHQTTRRTRQTRRPPYTARPSTTSPASSTSGSSGVSGVSCPPMGPYFFPHPQTYLPASSEGVSYRPDPDRHVIAAKPLAIGTRAAPCGALWLGVLPYPCPGQYAHQWALIAREGRKLGITWMTALVAKADSCRSSNPEVGCLLCPTFCRLGYNGVNSRLVLKAAARENPESGFSID